MIIRNIINQALKEDFNKDVQGKKICTHLDDSTDISTVKLLCILVRYFSEKESSILIALICIVDWFTLLERSSSRS